MDAILGALNLIADPYVILLICLSSAFGLFVGAMPGLTATMATALLVPVTFFMPPLPAMAVIVTTSCMAIFAGDIPGALLRIPGTPASAAYTNEAYAMTVKGQAETALGAGVVFSAIGGIFGTAVLATSAPLLAEVAIKFSSFEYFWLVCLGLTCAVFIALDDPVKGMIALFIGLGVALIGLENPAGLPRFTFGVTDLMSGIDMIPAMIGMFAIAEALRIVAAATTRLPPARAISGSIFRGQWQLTRKYPVQILRGSTIGTLIGALPGAGADIASWITYATAKRFSKEPEKFGTGHPEGIVESGAANNAAVSGAWIPALVFGIPGDSITAIVIGVLYLKNIIPGPMVFVNQPALVTGIFALFFLANLILIPFGWLAIKSARHILAVPREILMPIVLLFCIVGAFAVTNSPFAIGVMLVFGLIGFLMEEHGFPVAPVILGIILGPMLEQNFVTSMIKSDGSFFGFFNRPIAAFLGVVTLAVWGAMLWRGLRAIRAPQPV
ncbi:MAG: tripartite tricarboxylate transporter permease [Alphaproteobacteria bacterium]|nr:tripartite tricarboxylate transporter permease [Alphaproteobacteria bacterium]